MNPELGKAPDDHQYQFSTDNCSPSVAVIEAVARVTNRDPVEFGPLSDIVDSDALNRIVTNSDDVTISFELEGLEVQVTSSGNIIIE